MSALRSDDEASTQIFFDDTEIVEQSWSQVSYDVSAVADGNASFTITFGISSGHGTTQSGWNVDDLVLRGVTSESCEPVARALSGATSGLELSVDGSGLQLAWQADCGGGSVYDIYRGDLDQGDGSLAAEPGFCNHAASDATLPLGTGDREFFLVVPSDGAFAAHFARCFSIR